MVTNLNSSRTKNVSHCSISHVFFWPARQFRILCLSFSVLGTLGNLPKLYRTKVSSSVKNEKYEKNW